MLQSLLAGGVLGCLLAGRLNPWALLGICLALTAGIWLLRRVGRHHHDNWSAIDGYAQRSQLEGVSAGLKGLTALACIILVLAANEPAVSVLALLLASGLTVLAGKTPPAALGRLFLTPATFVLLSGLALLFDISNVPLGVVQIPLFGTYLCITAAAQAAAARIMLNALACVAWLYALCLSTPLYSLIAALRKIRVPNLMIELMYLIYRYIFVLSRCMSQMQTAAQCRLGTASARAGLRSAGRVMTGLLSASFRKASASFDAMQARCYGGKLQFLERPHPIRALHTIGAAAIVAALTILMLTERGILS